MTTYNLVNTGAFDAFMAHWPAGEPAPSDTARAIALTMPSVSNGGVRSKRGGTVSGEQAFYHAFALMHGDGNITEGCRDSVWAAWQLAFNSANGRDSTPSNKTNHLTWLAQAGLIEVSRLNGVRFSTLTDAGLAQVKAVGGAELAKLAKAYTGKAFAKAREAYVKASQPVKAPRKAKVAKAETATSEAPTAVDAIAGFDAPVDQQLEAGQQ